jgi:hypothetical protein
MYLFLSIWHIFKAKSKPKHLMQLTTKPQYSITLCILLILFGTNLFAQFNPFIIGEVYTPDGTSLEVPPTDIRISLTSSGGTAVFTGVTSYNANASSNPYFFFFSYSNNNTARIYVDKATTDDDYVDLLCIKSSDAVWINMYLLGNYTLTPAQKVAANVNIDGVISVADVLAIHRVILGIDDKFNNSLTIDGVTHSNISAVYPTTDDLSALSSSSNIQYACTYEYNPLLTSLIGRNFAAIRLGDVNQDCDNFFTGN